MKSTMLIRALLVGGLLLAAPVTGSLAQSARQTSPLGPECHPNYALVCVPIAKDVDCAGGNGNGPAYVKGPVQIIGDDVYELDRDGDGIACEPTKSKK